MISEFQAKRIKRTGTFSFEAIREKPTNESLFSSPGKLKGILLRRTYLGMI